MDMLPLNVSANSRHAFHVCHSGKVIGFIICSTCDLRRQHQTRSQWRDLKTCYKVLFYGVSSWDHVPEVVKQGSFADGKGRTGKKPTLAGAPAKNPISGRGRVQRARAGPARRRQKILFQAGVVCRRQGLDREHAHSSQGRQQKSLFQAGIVCGWQGPDRQEAYPGRGASKKSYFRQGSCAEGKGLTGNERKWRPTQPKCKEMKAHKAKMQGNEGPQGQNARKWRPQS